MHRRRVLALAPAAAFATLATLSGCAGSAAPAQVAADIQTEASGLGAALAALPIGTIPATVLSVVQQAVADLATVAGALSGADMPTASVIERVQTDVEAVIDALDGRVPANVQTIITAAAALLPVIIQAAETLFPALLAALPLDRRVLIAAARQPGLTAAQARAILLAAKAA